jgi:hypothetical protein
MPHLRSAAFGVSLIHLATREQKKPTTIIRMAV